MSTTASVTVITSQPPHMPTASLEDICGCTAAIFWCLRTLKPGLSVFDHPYDIFAKDVAADDEYAADLVELYKGIVLDQIYQERRAAMADRVVARIGAALAARHDPATDAALRQPIDVERLPRFPDIPAWRVNETRPALPWPIDF
ncbi:hypothetical protein [Aromatoleum evansii]|uniref:hypothetical protein n=1 Tax=Aromatoleum evansii TaxID=59406 RepID=UPI00145F042F|nr:hypothetical protein [Aromatoleum evansii]NMG31097.1 hypothetical protein [Aromatoleum evansii]